MHGLKNLEPIDTSVICCQSHNGELLKFDVGAGQRDVLLGMLRMFTAQAAAGVAPPLPTTKSVGLYVDTDASSPYQPQLDVPEERGLQMAESDWRRVLSLCARSRWANKDDVIVQQGGTDPASTSRCYGISKGGISLERATLDGVTRYATLGENATFNEMSLVLTGSAPPSVNAVSLEDNTLVYYIDSGSFTASGDDAMFEARLLRWISGRLRDALDHGRRVCTHHNCALSEL